MSGYWCEMAKYVDYDDGSPACILERDAKLILACYKYIESVTHTAC